MSPSGLAASQTTQEVIRVRTANVRPEPCIVHAVRSPRKWTRSSRLIIIIIFTSLASVVLVLFGLRLVILHHHLSNSGGKKDTTAFVEPLRFHQIKIPNRKVGTDVLLLLGSFLPLLVGHDHADTQRLKHRVGAVRLRCQSKQPRFGFHSWIPTGGKQRF